MKFQGQQFFILLLLLVGSYFLFSDGLSHFVVRSVKELWNLGHIVYFALMVFFLVKLGFLKKLSLPFQWIAFIVLSLLGGTLIEVLQYGTQREPDLADIFRDVTGCLLVLAFYSPLLKISSTTGKLIIRLVVLTLLLIQLMPLGIALMDEAIARNQFPVLSNFETPFEVGRWGGDAAKEIVNPAPGGQSSQLKIGLTTAMYSGVGMEYLPVDWSRYQSVYLKIYQPSDAPLKITVRIHDSEHVTGAHRNEYFDRFNKSFALKKGWNEIVISLEEVRSAVRDRKMNLNQIRGVSLFAIRLPQSRIIYLDSIGLQ